MENGIGSRFRIKKNADMPQRWNVNLEEDENLVRLPHLSALSVAARCSAPWQRQISASPGRLAWYWPAPQV
jgi:hypothetical protein